MVANRLAFAFGIAVAAAAAGVPALAADQAQPPQPSAAASEPSTAQTPAGSPGAPAPSAAAESGAEPDSPAGTTVTDAVAPPLFVGPPEPPWRVGPAAPGIEELVEGLYVVSGSDGNRVVRVTSEGVVVAGESTAAIETVAALVDGVTEQPVRYFLETQWHGNQRVLPASWQSARLVALEQAEPLPAGAVIQNPRMPPDLAFSRGLSFFLGEAEVQLRHFAPAHTATDAVVLFPDLGVLYAGDLVRPGLPFIDYASGGSSRGWVETLDGILALDFRTVIPGVGPALTKPDVQTFRDRLVTLRMRAMQLLYRNVAPRDALPLLQTTDLDWPLTPEGPFATRSFATFYDELAVERRQAREAAAAETDEDVEEPAR